MKQISARTVGGPGAGKTRRLLEIVEKCLETVTGDPFKIGFVSFTRAARREASDRASKKFNVKAVELEKEGWYRTLHSCCYKLLGLVQGDLLLGTAEDGEWLKNALNDDDARLAPLSMDEDYLTTTRAYNDSGKALSLWDAARARLCPVEQLWEVLNSCDDRTPPLDDCCAKIDLYEDAKKADGRLDFYDSLMRYAGKKFSGDHSCPFADAEPQGTVPDLPVWIHDEAQDMSPLTALVFRRISSTAKYVYLAGDDRQAIFGFCGSNGSIFADWSVAKEEILPLSHRCKSKILERADELIHRSYRPRPFKSKDDGGVVDEMDLTDVLQEIEPGQDVLVLARTNEYAKEAAEILDDNLIPWKPIKGGGGFNAPARAAGVKALIELRCGLGIDGEGIYRMMQLLDAKTEDGVQLIARGWKTKFDDEEYRKCVGSALNNLDLFGATEALKQAIDSGDVQNLLEPAAQKMYAAGMKYNVEALGPPTIRVGTCHAAKGLESSHVVLYNRIPFPTQRAIQEEENLHEERRVWYVALTRAKDRTTIACNFGEQFNEL